MDQKIPGELDGFFLEIVAKREVAEHFEKGMVARTGADIFKIVVLTRHPHALLAGGSALIRPLFQTQEDIFKLHHARICKEQGWVVRRHQVAAVHNFMAEFVKIFKPELAYFAS